MKRMIEKVCTECNKKYVISSQWAFKSKFCSRDCANARNRREEVHKKSSQVVMICQYCNKEFSIRKTTARVQKYCSKKCSGLAHIGTMVGDKSPVWKEKVLVACGYCGKTFEAHQSRAKHPMYCNKIHSVLSNLKRFKEGKRTGIEIKMADALRKYNIDFEEQVVMFEKFQVDFMLSNKIIVQCDGLYWHDRPKARAKDKGQDNYFSRCGYTVLRFTDKEIDSDIDMCIQKIMQISRQVD